ncbi:MAG TPA: hypothetical protein VHT00_14105 [Stellaceae bacterium]|jgi:hypothetical protein|nr:hypothetical protein [Stellaceae bacterium]
MHVKRYIEDRNEMLLQRDPDALIAFMKRHKLPRPRSRAAAELTLHKTITSAVSLPDDVRRASKQWLTERGYHSLDDGEL